MPRTWTSEQKAKQAALIHNWQPWNNSTGATTAQGKATCSMNACKGYKRKKKRESWCEFKSYLRTIELLIQLAVTNTPEATAAFEAIASKYLGEKDL